MITLNDEQEKALREWWSRRGAGDGKRGHVVYYNKGENPADKIKMIAEDAALVDAIAPLMRVTEFAIMVLPSLYQDKPKWAVLDSKCNERAATYNKEDARRICDLLNESEASK